MCEREEEAICECEHTRGHRGLSFSLVFCLAAATHSVGVSGPLSLSAYSEGV